MLSEFQVMCTINQLYFAVILISQRRSDFRNLNAFQMFFTFTCDELALRACTPPSDGRVHACTLYYTVHGRCKCISRDVGFCES